MHLRPGSAAALALVLLTPRCPAGEFDRIEGAELARIVSGEGAATRASLTVKELDALPTVLKGERAAFLVVKTGQGNYARVLATSALRKAPEGGEAVPVFVLERFDTFEPGRSGSRLAKGAGVLLFDGFQIDLDGGQIVPAGQGGDLAFRKDGKYGPTLSAVGKAAIVTPTKPVDAGPAGAGPSAGKALLAADFSGRYRVTADGRRSGVLELRVGADRIVSGRFRSEANGTAYPVTGQVAAEPPGRATFMVKFPRTEHEYDAYLATDGKNALAGTFTTRGRTFGFFAVREGATGNTAGGPD